VQVEYVLDEGGAITTGLIAGVTAPVAVVGIAEKGYVSLELTAHATGGHSSMPPAHTAVGMLSAAVARLEANKMPRAIRGATAAMLDYIGPEMPYSRRLALANQWLFGPVIRGSFGATPSGDAMLRTTTAPTIFQAGVKDNVLPSTARAVVNFRLLPGDSVATVLDHARRVVADTQVTVAVLGASATEPSPVSPTSSEDFAVVQRTIRQVAPGTVVTPWLVVGGTRRQALRGVDAQRLPGRGWGDRSGRLEARARHRRARRREGLRANHRLLRAADSELGVLSRARRRADRCHCGYK